MNVQAVNEMVCEKCFVFQPREKWAFNTKGRQYEFCNDCRPLRRDELLVLNQELTTEVATLNHEIDEAEDYTNGIDQDLDDTKRANAVLQAKVDELTALNQTNRIEIDNIIRLMTKSEDQFTKAKHQGDEMVNACQQMKTIIIELKTENDKLKADMGTAHTAADALISIVEERDTTISQLRADVVNHQPHALSKKQKQRARRSIKAEMTKDYTSVPPPPYVEQKE